MVASTDLAVYEWSKTVNFASYLEPLSLSHGSLIIFLFATSVLLLIQLIGDQKQLLQNK